MFLYRRISHLDLNTEDSSMKSGYVFGINNWDCASQVLYLLNEKGIETTPRVGEIIHLIYKECGFNYSNGPTTVDLVDWPSESTDIFYDLDSVNDDYEYFPAGLLFQVLWQLVKKEDLPNEVVIGMPPVITGDGCENVLCLRLTGFVESPFYLDASAANTGVRPGRISLAGRYVLASRRPKK